MISYIPVGNGNGNLKINNSKILEYTQGTYIGNQRVVTTNTVYGISSIYSSATLHKDIYSTISDRKTITGNIYYDNVTGYMKDYTYITSYTTHLITDLMTYAGYATTSYGKSLTVCFTGGTTYTSELVNGAPVTLYYGVLKGAVTHYSQEFTLVTNNPSYTYTASITGVTYETTTTGDVLQSSSFI